MTEPAGAPRPGDDRVLGAHWTPEETTFAVFSSVASAGGAVTLCLVDQAGGERGVQMWPEQDVWTCTLSGLAPGQHYGYRVQGPYDPARGWRFDPARLLVDPYARAITTAPDGGPRARHGLLVDPAFDWQDDRPPRIPWSETVLYEAHVKGATILHPQIPPSQRGSYAALASDVMIAHLTRLGVTTVELLPIQEFVSEQLVLNRGLTNYWGYSTLGYFAPHASYSASGTRGQQVGEFREMVKRLHAAGIEVVLDVVFNHTCEGAADQPALSMRGLADDVYYRSDPAHPERYLDTTGTGNSLDTGRPEVLRLVLDSLRYWVEQMHVDGFRFDLAAALARQHGYFDKLAAFFALVYQDPVLVGTKLIAEPWDLGAPDGYQVGRFPPGWAEWNDHYRDTVRDFWRGACSPADLGYRLTGSSDLYAPGRRGPDASINFVVAHDGKTLTDLVTYVDKYNQANGEGNNDGTPDDRAANYGVEGPTSDSGILAIRNRQRRNMLATLMVSQGVPMLAGGDEIGRTQHGNNNAYCQDNQISWFDWHLDPDQQELARFVGQAVQVQRRHPALRRRSFLTGLADGEGALPDVTWFDATGAPLTAQSWQDSGNHFLGLLLAGEQVGLVDSSGIPQRDDDLLIMLNASVQPADVRLPGRPGATYKVELDTTQSDGAAGQAAPVLVGELLTVPPRTLLVAAAPLHGQ